VSREALRGGVYRHRGWREATTIEVCRFAERTGRRTAVEGVDERSEKEKERKVEDGV
jgi:hypothetical protein